MTGNRPADFELPCTECRVLTRVVFLRDASDLAPFAGLVCPVCEAKFIADAHSEHECDCEVCMRSTFTPAGAGGFAPGMLELLSDGADNDF